MSTSKKWSRIMLALLIPAGVILLALPLRSFISVSDVMLLGVACVTYSGFRYGKAEAMLSSVVSVVFVDVLFVQPYYTLAVHNFEYFVSFGVMLAVGVFIAQLAQRNQLVELEKQATVRLKEREEIRANLLRSIGHDLRSPLGTIMGASSLIMDDQIPLSKEQYREQATNIYQQSLILKNQIDKMLELSRIRDLQTTNDWLNLPSEDLVSAAFARTKASQNEAFQVTRQVEFIKGDGALLEVALANLIDNATRHGVAPFQITLEQQASEFCIRVCNRIDRVSVARPDSGTGLGLLICDAIAKLHNGAFYYQQGSHDFEAVIRWKEQ